MFDLRGLLQLEDGSVGSDQPMMSDEMLVCLWRFGKVGISGLLSSFVLNISELWPNWEIWVYDIFIMVFNI